GIENTEMFKSLQLCMNKRIPLEVLSEFNFPDGSKGWFELTIQPVQEGILILSSDVTKLKNAEAELKKKLSERTEMLVQITKQKQQLEEFCQIIAHNLRAPLSNLLLLNDMINQSDTTEEKLEYIKIQNPVINMLHDTFQELISATQVKMDLTVKKNQIQLEKQTPKIIHSLRKEIAESNAFITCDFSEINTITYPKKYLNNIIYNLLSNAVRYHSLIKTPKIHIKSYIKDEWVYLEIKDNGLGIDLKRNKNDLFKLHKTFHNHPKAKGFGLFITKTQVEVMNGNIYVKSSPNKGSTFSVKLYKITDEE
ncbi:HAMP domain-containing sensor histidine kinase, partial [Flavobacterium sp.]|uniref:sensor histidine kinase n=1 Tax=Flavobacterium sp. TaxID=239 RepID=UPI00262A35E7